MLVAGLTPGVISLDYSDIKEIIRKKGKERRLGHGTPYAMRRHKAWRGGSKAQQSCVPATALGA